jgi:uncharacterized membrane protein
MSDDLPIALLAVYPNRAFADAAVAHLLDMERRDDFKVDGIAVVTKDVVGKVTTEEVGGTSGRHGSRRGAVLGAVVGIVFPPSVVAATVIGAAVGGVIDHSRGSSHTHRRLQSIGGQIDRGHTGVIVIVNDAASGRAASSLVGYKTLYRVPIDFNTPVPDGAVATSSATG